MDIVSFSIKKPVTILVGIILVILFGVISLQTLPSVPAQSDGGGTGYYG